MSRVAGEGTTTRVKDRWAAVEQAAKALTAQQVVDIVAHAFAYTGSMTELLRKHAREVDVTYVTEDDALEVQILAAGAVANLLTGDSEHKRVAALGVIATTFGREVPEFMCKDLLVLASQCLQNAAEQKRANPSLVAWDTKALLDSMTKAIPTPEAGVTGTVVLTTLTTMIEQVKGQLAKHATAIGSAATLQSESSDLAFLIVSEYSASAEKLVSELTFSDAVFAIGKDLYDVTSSPPVLPSYEAIIKCLLRPLKPVKKALTLEAVIDGLSESVRSTCMHGEKVTGLATPLQYCLQKKGEVAGGDWRPAFEQGTRLRADMSVTVAVVAQQVYVESCLLWALGAA